MENFLDSLSRVTGLWNGILERNSYTMSDPLGGISSYGSMNTTGIINGEFIFSAGRKAVCTSGMIEVRVVAETVEVLYPGPANNYELTEFITGFLRLGSDTFSTSLGNSTTITDSFEIYTKLCIPAETSNEVTSVQFLTHGGTTDSSYWDFEQDYSYVDAAAERGYATFSYDRLGAGKSEHPDPKQLVQVPLQVELAHVLIQKLRQGSIGGLSFKTVVGIGHSLGSALTQSITAKYPDDLDAVILTGHSGFSQGAGTGFAAAAQQIANTVPDRPQLKQLPNGYYTLGPVAQALQFAFFYYPHFDPKVFQKEFRTRQTNALGETLTLGALYVPAPEFRKPVQLLNGRQDYFYCQGDCMANECDITTNALVMFYPNRLQEKSEAVTIADMGHNVNFHYGRLAAFRKMLDFISKAGIQP